MTQTLNTHSAIHSANGLLCQAYKELHGVARKVEAEIKAKVPATSDALEDIKGTIQTVRDAYEVVKYNSQEQKLDDNTVASMLKAKSNEAVSMLACIERNPELQTFKTEMSSINELVRNAAAVLS